MHLEIEIKSIFISFEQIIVDLDEECEIVSPVSIVVVGWRCLLWGNGEQSFVGRRYIWTFASPLPTKLLVASQLLGQLVIQPPNLFPSKIHSDGHRSEMSDMNGLSWFSVLDAKVT